MKSKTPTKLAKNASKLHKHIGNLLTSEDSIFKNFEIRQEYPVNKLNPEFNSSREKYDWVILSPFVPFIIEVMGRQHTEFIPFFHKTKYDFIKQQERDAAKKEAALKAGYAYITISYKEPKITLEALTNRIQKAIEISKLAEKIIPIRPKQKIQNSDNKIQNRGFQNPPEGHVYKWPKRKIKNKNIKKDN